MQGAKTKQSTTPRHPVLFSIVEGQVDWAVIGGRLTVHKSWTKGSWRFMGPGMGCERTRSGWILDIESEWGKMSSVQYSHSVLSDSLRPHWLQHTRPPCPSPTPGVYSNSCPLMISIGVHHVYSCPLVTPSNHLILCCPLLLSTSIFPSIRVFSSESALRFRWPKYWSFSFNIRPSNEHSELISFRMDWLQTNGLWRVFFNTPVQKHQFFGAQLSLYSNSHIHTWLLEKP